MLNVIDSINWGIYRHDAFKLEIRTALVNLISDRESERLNGFYDLSEGINISIDDGTSLAIDLVTVLFKLMQFKDFEYKDLISELLLIAGQVAESKATRPETVKQQIQLRRVICEQLDKYMSTSRSDLNSEVKDDLAYLESICKTE